MTGAMDPVKAATVTLVFTDIAGSTRLLEELGDAYATLIADHHQLVTAAAVAHGGQRVDAAGDGLFFSFTTAKGALLACVDAQRAVRAHAWPGGAEVRVRMGIHTGEPLSAASGYVGMDVHRAARICGAGHGGQILISEVARTLIGTALPEGATLRDLGEHRLKDLARPEHLFQAVVPDLPSEFPPVRSLETLPNNLPRQLSSFVGRDREIADAIARLAGTSLLTLTGPGGVGKTRLAVEVGARTVDEYPDGVWFVELGALDDEWLVADTIASTLKLQAASGGAVEALADALAGRCALLILDNCEHVLEALVTVVAATLRRCPNVTILATSREALGIEGEALMPVPSLGVPAIPEERDEQIAERLAESDAVRLFVERSRAVQPGFALNADNAMAVAQICRRLDGIPLAVELAAARVRALPPQQIAARLDDRFRLLTGGSRTALPRHRTLRAAFDWSFDLLPESERVLLTRLSVFSGTFSLEAAEAVCSGGSVQRVDVVDLLSRLVDKSLLVPEEASAEARYRMLETIRDYGQERLSESGEALAIQERRRDWFLALVKAARAGFFAGPEHEVWVRRLSDDHDNLRAVLQWTHEDPDGADAELELVSSLWRFWELRGHLAEGSTWLASALARTGGEVSTRRASTLTGAGVLAALRGDHAAAAPFHEAALVLQRELGNPVAISAACNNLASASIETGNLDRARELYAEAIDLARGAGDLHGAALQLLNMADLAARQGDAAEAEHLYTESIEALAGLGDEWGVAQATARLAQAARRAGDYSRARSHYATALEVYGRIGDRRGEARMRAGLGDVAAAEGDHAAAARTYRESLSLRSELRDRAGVAAMLERLAGVTEDDPERAARLLGMAAGLRERIGAALSAGANAEVDQFLAKLEQSLGDGRLAAAMSEGRRCSLEAAVEYALAES